ncbi:hypothetical protein BCIN_09g04910 [Botrytis cinerea B05.10]|uniref:Roadblock/LAMTOR2 domain-containing protein n=4 Tax=Sclerotiniaceae TaxID=28983 RepID=A0A384JT93_BOTFB|nr:hypothetical protein BCIN_09g04910 [Botrytis cinerea B05.10]ATZ53701.1 hypothetical protein BCIN_09g04910 [Botrytis cinerea B05.10]EMR90345.1 hypothetical protein BcDW1_1160 [Botrytis cinerea BcDW1]CCD43214.1 hypothetical protein BofuT4_P013230.1 [Botrytis cinerea T4]
MPQITDQLTGSGAEALAETLARLSKKPGVEATLVLEASSGTIIQNSGSFSAFRSTSRSNNTGASTEDSSTAANTESQGIEELASMVWSFAKSAGGLVQGLDVEDEVKLLRLRTKKHELVIVPDTKYILVVVHETPPA